MSKQSVGSTVRGYKNVLPQWHEVRLYKKGPSGYFEEADEDEVPHSFNFFHPGMFLQGFARPCNTCV